MNRLKSLQRILDGVNAGCQWSTELGPKVGVSGYLANGKLFLIMEYGELDDHHIRQLTGWDIYIPACEQNNVKATEDKLKEYLGVEPTSDGFDAFVEQFKPVVNPNITDAPYDGCLYETHGLELAAVLEFRRNNPKNIFTLIEAEGKSIISSGYHIVNRLGYFITEVAYTEDVEFIP